MGEVSLGNAKLDRDTLTKYADILSSWDKYLDTDGDILLYGCNVGAGIAGAEFVDDFSQYTQADILASTDITGNKYLGGDWDLELAVGDVEETTLFAAEIEYSYDRVLFDSGFSFNFPLPDTYIDPSFFTPSAPDFTFADNINFDPYVPPSSNVNLPPNNYLDTYDFSDPIVNTSVLNFTPAQIDFNSTDFDYSSLSVAANTISFGFEPTEFDSMTSNFEFLSAINSPDAVGFAFEDYKFDFDSRFSFDADSVTIGSDTITFEYDPNSLDFSSADLFKANADLFDYKFLDSEVSLVEGEIPFAQFNASDYRALEYAFVGDELFDPEYYLAQNAIPEGMNPFTHYIENGYPAGLDPNALFDVDYYLSTNPDVAIAGIDPLQHYAQFGWKTGLDPSQFFDTSYYLELYDDVRITSYESPSANPLQEYLEFGIAEGRVTHELFEGEAVAAFSTVVNSDSEGFKFVQNHLNQYGVEAFPGDNGEVQIASSIFGEGGSDLGPVGLVLTILAGVGLRLYENSLIGQIMTLQEVLSDPDRVYSTYTVRQETPEDTIFVSPDGSVDLSISKGGRVLGFPKGSDIDNILNPTGNENIFYTPLEPIEEISSPNVFPERDEILDLLSNEPFIFPDGVEIQGSYVLAIDNQGISRGLERNVDLSLLVTKEEKTVAEQLIAEGNTLVAAGGEENVKKTLKISPKIPGIKTADFISITSSQRFNLTEVKGSDEASLNGANIATAEEQLKTVYNRLNELVPGAKLGKVEVAVPKGARIRQPYEVRGNQVFKVSQEGAEVVRIGGKVLTIRRF